ncbi:MAG: FlgD immunoglobulin-like domain containing protein [bacterium]|jgi:hypothetical protein
MLRLTLCFILTVCVLALLGGTAPASEPTRLWEKEYGAPYNDAAKWVENVSTGGFILVGNTTTTDTTFGDVSMIRINPWGDTLWTKQYGGIGGEAAEGVRETPDGGFIVAGLTTSYGEGSADCYVIRTDSNGDTLWTRTYGGPGYDNAYGIDLAHGGGYVITGIYEDAGGDADVYLVRIDDNGDTLWTNTYGGSAVDWAMRVRRTSDGGYIMAGETRSYADPVGDAYLVKVDSGGAMEWHNWFGGTSVEVAYDVCENPSNGFVAVGYTSSSGAGSSDFFLIQTLANGDTVWTKTYGGTDYDVGHSIALATDYSYLIAGSTRSYGAGNMDAYVMKVSPAGDFVWGEAYGGADYDDGFCLQETPDEGIIMCGRKYVSGMSYQAFAVRILGYDPLVWSVADVPNDQGGEVTVAWFRSAYDYERSPTPITEYSIWRRIDQWSLAARGQGASPPVPALLAGLSYPPGNWDYVTTVPATHAMEYYEDVPTLCDSTIVDGMCWSAFCVLAHTTYPPVYYTSNVDSGYSVDNIAPAAPTNLHMSSSTDLDWDDAPEADFDYFTVYGGPSPDFAEADFMGYTIYSDYDVSGAGYNYYFVTATDFAGNEGGPAAADNTAGVPGSADPVAFAIRESRPNPFGASTTIAFDIPRPAHVTLEVIDIEGRVVATLVDETRDTGRYSAAWDGRVASGANAGPGVYFVRMKAGGFSATRKVMLLR